MSYIPYYYDNDVMAAILVFWAIMGAVAVVRGRRRSLPKHILGQRAAAAAGCAVVSLIVYNGYILERQVVEAREHRTFGEPARYGRPQ